MRQACLRGPQGAEGVPDMTGPQHSVQLMLLRVVHQHVSDMIGLGSDERGRASDDDGITGIAVKRMLDHGRG